MTFKIINGELIEVEDLASKVKCAVHYKVMTNITYTEQDYQCRICQNPEGKSCYVPYNPQSGFLISRGRVRCEEIRAC